MGQFNQTPHKNHRQRVYQEIEDGGIDHLPEHRVLECMLFTCVPRIDTNPLSHALIKQFGSLAGVLEASEAQLMEVVGVGPVTARYLHTFPLFSRYYAMSKAKHSNRLSTTEARAEYLLSLFRGLKTEAFYMIALDERAQLIRPILLSEGSASESNIPVPKLIGAASSVGAVSVLFAHNHPGKIAMPSQSDIDATGNMIRALGVIEVRVLDHIIVANEEHYSMFEQGILPFFNMKTGELRFY